MSNVMRMCSSVSNISLEVFIHLFYEHWFTRQAHSGIVVTENVMCRSAHGTFDEISLALSSSLLSFAIGSICIALVALYHQDEAVLIVIACSTILHGFTSFPLILFFQNTHIQTVFIKVLSIFFQLITLGAAIEYFNHTTKQTIATDTHLRSNLLIGIDSLLLCSFFVNGINVGYRNSINSSGEDKIAADFDESKPFTFKTQDRVEKHIPLKNSAQTLTPDMDIVRNLNYMHPWDGGQTQVDQSEEEASLSSVIQHRLKSMNQPKSPTTGHCKTSKIPHLKAAISKPTLRKSFVFKFTSPKGLGIKSTLRSRKRDSSSPIQDADDRNGGNHYTVRLSTIPDLSRSMLNVTSSSQDFDSQNRGSQHVDTVSEPTQCRVQSRRTSSIPAIELERNAVERINSALLPPCLKITESFKKSSPPSLLNVPVRTLAPMTPEHSVENSIEKHDLEDIPQIPQTADESLSNFFAEHNKSSVDIPENVTMEIWENSKDRFLQRAATLHHNGGLLPAFHFSNENTEHIVDIPELHAKTNFSFPLQKPQELQPKFKDDNYDTISALEEYFRDIDEHDDEGGGSMQNGFAYHNKSSSFNSKRLSRELHRTSTKHSPTKSIISMISGRDSLGHHRSQTILMNPNKTDGLGNGSPTKSSPNRSSPTRSSPTRSSPTRSQRLRRMGKKLSLSNISDTMINMGVNAGSSNEYPLSFKKGHPRGKSIDFSYIHNLQSHSPTKSASAVSSHHGSIYGNRRHSVATEHGLATINSPFYQPSETALMKKCKTPPIRSTSDKSSQFSNESTTNYPDIVMSEYDRERWNTMLTLEMIDSRGQLKTNKLPEPLSSQ